MNQTDKPGSSIVISYLTLRKTIGWLGLALPFLLTLGAWIIFSEEGVRSSISAYYYSDMRDVFVGTLCTIGFFLFSYKGYERKDDVAGDLACAMAIGVAVFPTAPSAEMACYAGRLVYCPHGFFAGGLFLLLAYFCLVLFTKSASDAAPTRQKLQRNAVYRGCGYTILVCILLVPALYVVKKVSSSETVDAIMNMDPVFWLETFAILAFAASWLTKGEAILKDKEPA